MGPWRIGKPAAIAPFWRPVREAGVYRGRICAREDGGWDWMAVDHGPHDLTSLRPVGSGHVEDMVSAARAVRAAILRRER